MENFELWIDQEEEYIPHYEKFEEELRERVLSDLQSLAGINFTVTFPPSTGSGGFLPDNYLTPAAAKEYSWPAFLREIGEAGHRDNALTYLDYEIHELTTTIREHPFSGGNIMPPVSEHDEDDGDFWGNCEAGNRNPQRLQVMREHRAWMVNIRQRLFVDRTMKAEPAALPPITGKGQRGKSKEITFESLFTTPGTATRLNNILQSPAIAWVHKDGKWIGGKKELPILFHHLEKEGLLTSEACKLPAEQKHILAGSYFRIKMARLHFSNTLKECAADVFMNEGTIRKCNLITMQLKQP